MVGMVAHTYNTLRVIIPICRLLPRRAYHGFEGNEFIPVCRKWCAGAESRAAEVRGVVRR